MWRALTVYTRYPLGAFASELPDNEEPGFFAMFVPAWDESAVIAAMLRATLGRHDHPNYRIFVGHDRGDPATAAAIAGVADERIEAVEVDAGGRRPRPIASIIFMTRSSPTRIRAGGRRKAVVLHDAEDVVHPLELGCSTG